jgi:hypothetical protein
MWRVSACSAIRQYCTTKYWHSHDRFDACVASFGTPSRARRSLEYDEETLRIEFCNNPNLQSLDLASNNLESAGLTELTPALYRNTSIKVLDLSDNYLNDMESAELLREIIRRTKTINTLYLSGNAFGPFAGAVDCIAEGLGSNSTLLTIDLSSCCLMDDAVATPLGSRNTTLQKLSLKDNYITSADVGVLFEMMEHNSRITDLDLRYNGLIGNEGAILLAGYLGNNSLANLTCLSLSNCGIEDDGFIALMSALQQNTSLLQLDLRYYHAISERAFLGLAESLPETKVLQQVDLSWCTGFASAMPLLLSGVRKNTSLFRIQLAHCVPSSVPPTPEDTTKCAGGWMQEMERLGYRNRFSPLIRAPAESLPPRGIWPHALVNTLARVATLPDVIFEVLPSKPSLVPSEDREGDEEVAEDTGVPKERKHGDEVAEDTEETLAR